MVGQEKKPKVSVLHPRGQQGQIHYGKCGNPYGRECRAVGSGCFRCGQSGHMSRDCPWDALIFFHCYQIGHKKVDFLSGGAVAAPGPTTLRINDGRQGMAETPVVKIRGFKLTTDEDRETLDVVTRTFLSNGMTDHVLFNLGATQSFISLELSKKFSDAPEILDYPLEVEIADDRSVSASSGHRGCVLSMFNERYSIDLFLMGP
ncbi:uncharacterized protein LOC111895585 [Lactuca sativa]|uniref:uncharacterized protein LOC111895585 n=1 Tax=Lactuca sativa TaxID=4236 RepID=UPI000CD9073E|nr:uncharacterized protein LOC111895585 [Lactuca sativa]